MKSGFPEESYALKTGFWEEHWALKMATGKILGTENRLPKKNLPLTGVRLWVFYIHGRQVYRSKIFVSTVYSSNLIKC